MESTRTVIGVLLSLSSAMACIAMVPSPAEFGSTWSHENPSVLIDQPAPWVKPPLLTRAVFAAGLPNEFQVCWQMEETPRCVTLGYLRDEAAQDVAWVRCATCLAWLPATALVEGRCYFCRNLVRRPQFGWRDHEE